MQGSVDNDISIVAKTLFRAVIQTVIVMHTDKENSHIVSCHNRRLMHIITSILFYTKILLLNSTVHIKTFVFVSRNFIVKDM